MLYPIRYVVYLFIIAIYNIKKYRKFTSRKLNKFSFWLCLSLECLVQLAYNKIYIYIIVIDSEVRLATSSCRFEPQADYTKPSFNSGETTTCGCGCWTPYNNKNDNICSSITSYCYTKNCIATSTRYDWITIFCLRYGNYNFYNLVRNPTPKIVSTNATVKLPVATTSTTTNDSTLELLAAIATAQQPKLGEYWTFGNTISHLWYDTIMNLNVIF